MGAPGWSKTFPYRAVGERLGPMLPLSLVRANSTMTPQLYALVDSGADYSSFPGELTTTLGIDITTDCTGVLGNTAGGVTTNYAYPPGLDALVCGRKVHLASLFNPGLPIIILGREDFFQEFQVAFDQRAKTFTISGY